MANKKLIDDLKNLEKHSEYSSVRDLAGRALEEIEYLENQVREKQSALDWYDFEPGSMK